MAALNLDEPIFVFSEATEITGVSGKDLTNWTQREILNLGIMHRTGRRLYSIIDLVKLAIAGSLAPHMRPAFAMAVGQSDVVAPRVREVCALDDDGNLIHRGYHGKDEPQYLAVYAEPAIDNFKVGRVAHSKIAELFGVDGTHPVTIVPLDNLAKTVTLKAVSAFEREGK